MSSLAMYGTHVGWAVGLTLLFLVGERLAPAEERQPFAGWLFNMAYMPVLLAVALAFQVAIGPAFSALLNLAGGGLLPRVVRPPGGTAARLGLDLGFAVVWDVWQYWVHRWQHSSAFLWETHRFHHTEEALNASTQGRHHILHHVWVTILHLPVFLVFGAIAPGGVAAVLMFRLWGFVNHANVRVGFGPLTPVIAGPQWHRIHHSVRPEHRGRNFATFFPFVDLAFGTYYRPGPGEFPSTGVPGETESAVRQATLLPLAVWAARAASWVRRRSGKGEPPETARR